MPEKYFATSLTKTAIGHDSYVYSVDGLIAGDIDNDTQILTTEQGEKYYPITSYANTDDTKKHYNNPIQTDKVTDIFDGVLSFCDAIKEYEYRYSQIFYFVSHKGQGEAVVIPINIGPYMQLIDKINENPEAYEEAAMEKAAADEEEDDPVIDTIETIVSQIISGTCSPDDLVEIRDQLIDYKEAITSAIQSVNIAEEALEEEMGEAVKSEEKPVPKPQPLLEDEDIVVDNGPKPISVSEVYDKVRETVIDQDEAAKRVILEIDRLSRTASKPYSILLTGNTGVGKTLLMDEISKCIGRPFLAIDSTQLTVPGYVGRDIETYLWELYVSCGKNREKAENAVLYFDEIDKKGTERKNDANGSGVLSFLLKFLDGETYIACKNMQRQTEDTTVKISTKNMIIILGGAFLDVYKDYKKRSQIGFNAEPSSTENYSSPEPEVSDFVSKSMMTEEFMGRVPVIVHFKDLNVDSLVRILRESKRSIIKLQEQVFGSYGVKLTTKDGYIESVAEQADKRKIGARGLNKIVTDTTSEAYWDVASHPNKYSEVILTAETASNPKAYQLVKRPTPATH